MTTRALLANRANLMMQVCNTGSGFSAVFSGNAAGADKFCLCSPGT